MSDLISIMLGVFVFGVIVYRAYFMDITYDEAYSYLNTGRIQDVWKVYLFRIANTHLLNSLLMTVSTLFFPYNDFAIRLPSVLISGLYIVIAISFSKKFQNRFIALGLLILYHYIIEYMALARGYGMSATFILAAFYVYKNQSSFPKYYLWIAFLFLLAVYASYVAIVPFGIFAIYILVVDFKLKIPKIPIKTKRWIIGLSILALYGFYSVTKEGKPLYGAYHQSFIEAIPYDVMSRLFLFDISIQTVTWATLFFSLFVLCCYFISSPKSPVGMITILSFIAIVIAARVGNKPLPTGRVLVPYWPMLVLSFIEIIEGITKKIHIPIIIVDIINMGALAFMVVGFWGHMNKQDLVSLKKQQWKKPIYILSGYGKDIYPHDTYYLEKNQKFGLVENKLKSIAPNKLIDNNFAIFRVYDTVGLITVEFTNEEPIGSKMYRKVFNQHELIYADTITVGKGIFKFYNKQTLLLPYPRFGGDKLEIGMVNGNWNQHFDISDAVINNFPPEKPHSI